MTIENHMRQFINEKIAECHVEGAAIWDRMEAVETWRHRSTRPLDAHRAIKAFKRKNGHPNEDICALLFMAGAVKLAMDEMAIIEAKLSAYQTGLRLLDESYSASQK